jgi:hypothetical protein
METPSAPYHHPFNGRLSSYMPLFVFAFVHAIVVGGRGLGHLHTIFFKFCKLHLGPLLNSEMKNGG